MINYKNFVVDTDGHKRQVGQLYLIGSILRVYGSDRTVDLASDLDPDEAAEVAAEFGRGVRIPTSAR